MTILSPTQHAQYQREGVVFPLRILDGEKAGILADHCGELQSRMGHWVASPLISKPNLVSCTMADVIRNETLLDAVESIIGPDILCWTVTVFAKPPKSGGYVGWHQDRTYWGLSPEEQVVTVWLALTDAHCDNGCMSVLRGSHLRGNRDHEIVPDTENILLSGQEVTIEPHERDDLLHVELDPGEASIHHSKVLHGSNPNQSDRPRTGLSIQYISANVIQRTNGGIDSASAVRGNTSRSKLELEPLPVSDFDVQSIKNWKRFIVNPSGLGATADTIQLEASGLE